MTTYKFGNIVLVPFPFTDQTTTKKRPAVIVSSNAYNENRPDIIIMAITSQAHGSGGCMDDIRIQKWQHTGLLKPSVIKPIITTIEKKLVIKQLGSLTERDRAGLLEGLQTILGE